MSRWDAIVVGAGVAGLAAARELAEAGHSVLVLDKARRPGGRCATRRVAQNPASAWFDFGAQYFTQRDSRFRQALAGLSRAADIQLWQGRVGAVAEDGGLIAGSPGHRRYVCAGGMNTLARALASDLEAAGGALQLSTRVGAVERSANEWRVRDDTGNVTSAGVLVLAIPGPQAQELLGDHLLGSCAPEMTPCISVVVRLAQGLPYDGIFMNDPVLDWAANNHSKPGHPGGDGALWTLHAQPDYSAEMLQDNALETARTAMLQAFGRIAAATITPVATHAWRFARPAFTEGPGFHLDADKALALCGDWLNGGRVEGAWLSGHQLGCRLAASDDLWRQPGSA